MVWVLAKILQKTRMERNRERFVLSSRDIRDYLGYSKSNRTSLSLVIREAIDWGVLSQATTKEGKTWRGYYNVNWDAVEYVASFTVPKSFGRKALHNEYLTRHWLEFEQAKEVAKEFKQLLGGTRNWWARFWLAGEPEPEASPASPAGITPHTVKARRSRRPSAAGKEGAARPPRLRYLTATMVDVGPHRLPVIKLGDAYLLPFGVRGGAQSAFPCVRCSSPAGGARYLCAGSVKVLQEVLASAGPSPVCSIVGGGLAPTSLVADVPGQGLILFDYASADAPRLEPGVQLYDPALLACARRYHIIVSSTYRNSIGAPALILVPLKGVSKDISRRPDKLLSDLRFCLDAMAGARASILRGLPSLDSLSIRSVPKSLFEGAVLTDGGGGGQPEVLVERQLKVKERERVGGRLRAWWRHLPPRLTALSQFIGELDRYAKEGREAVVTYFKVIVPLRDSTGLGDLLNLAYLYIYNNPRKDPPNALRFELRAHSGVKQRLGKYGLLNLFVSAIAALGQPLEDAHRALSPGAP
jgi:hypothetical protein